MEKFSKEKTEIRKPPTYLYYLAGFILLFLIGFTAYYFGYDKYLQKQLVGGLVNQNQNLDLSNAPKNINQEPAQTTPKIYIDSPQENEVIGNPVTIKGRAEIKGTLTVRIRNANGKILGEATTLVEDEARRSDPTNYQTTFSYATSTTEFGLIEVFNLAKDESIQDLVSVKIKFADFGQITETTNLVPSDLEGWKTYRNEKASFEIKFPPIGKWNENIRIDDLDVGVPYFYAFFKTVAEGNIVYNIKINQFGELTPLLPDNFSTTDQDINFLENKTSETIFSGSNGSSVELRICLDKNAKASIPVANKDIDEAEMICGDKNSNLYDFILFCGGNKWQGEEGGEKCSQLFNQILSTFKFIE